MTPLIELAERVERVSGDDRILDAEIAIAVLGWREITSEEGDWRSFISPERKRVNVTSNGGFGGEQLPKFTASLDAAMQLVPKGNNYFPRVSKRFCGDWNADIYEQWSAESWSACAATPALALTSACLRALDKEGV